MTDQKTPMEGGCHCGSIRFRVSGTPSWLGACYCVDCRKVSGTPYTVFACYDKHSVELLRGAPKEYASSPNVRRSFCGECSSPLAYRYVDMSTEDKTSTSRSASSTIRRSSLRSSISGYRKNSRGSIFTTISRSANARAAQLLDAKALHSVAQCTEGDSQ